MIYSENILICILIPLIIAIIFLKGNARRFAFFFALGMVICLLSAYISGFIDVSGEIGQRDSAIYISPIVEEVMKLLPLLFYLFILQPENDELLVAAVSLGCGFATFENCCYILTKGADRLLYVLIRGMAVGVMHVVCTLSLTMGILVAKRFKVLSAASITGALALSMTFHGLYNLLVSSSGAGQYIGYFMPVVSAAALYLVYRKFLMNKE